MRVIIGITGASGANYGIRLLEVLSSTNQVETHLVISQAGELTIKHETDWDIAQVKELADCWYEIGDCGAKLSSGSFKRDAMVIAPCSIKTMSGLANSYAENLLLRAADVTLKEGKKLILLVRETPLHKGHLRNMYMLADMGAIILPPVPGFYNRPRTVQDIIDHAVGKVLDLLGIEHELTPRWQGISKKTMP